MEEEGVPYVSEVTQLLKRKRYIKTEKFVDEYGDTRPERLIESTGTAANLVSSSTNVGHIHLPVLDLDFPCKLVESSTFGHYHLYLDKPMAWKDYRMLLKCLEVAGLLNREWVRKALKDEQTFVRAPGVTK